METPLTSRCLLERSELYKSRKTLENKEKIIEMSVRLFRGYLLSLCFAMPRDYHRSVSLLAQSRGVNTNGTHRDFISARDRTVFGRTHASPESETRPAKIRTSKLKYFPFYRKTDKNMYGPVVRCCCRFSYYAL